MSNAIVCIVVAVLGLAGVAGAADLDVEKYIAEQTVPKRLVIVKSTTSWDEARRVASDAARRLKRPLELGTVEPLPGGGLTLPRAECEAESWEYPCYVPRGRWDDGSQVSVEYSSWYSALRPGQYIVVVESGPVDDAAVARAERDAKAVYPDAYSRTVEIYIGCMH